MRPLGRINSKNISLFLGEARTTRQLWGVASSPSPAQRMVRLKMRFNLTPGVYYTQPAVFPQACVSTFVCVLKHCVGHLNACTVFSCILHPSWGGVYTQEVYHENLRIYRPQAQGPGLPRIRWAM